MFYLSLCVRLIQTCLPFMFRSATMVIAYLMRHEGKPLKEAYRFVKSKRSLIKPNYGFWAELVDYEYHLFAMNTVRMITCKGLSVPDVYEEEVMRLH